MIYFLFHKYTIRLYISTQVEIEHNHLNIICKVQNNDCGSYSIRTQNATQRVTRSGVALLKNVVKNNIKKKNPEYWKTLKFNVFFISY